ncbi:hypothetical protein GGR52DRAFT_566985 [Hypoxylon sp. FL1284]|nr:hypothetical protein GGR52DRAFT_566985 [Hypoxylon sp. FL1284]
MSWTSIDMDKLILQANMRGPWGSDRRNASYSKQVYFNVTVDVPPEYPIKGLLQFTIEKTPEMKDETREQLDANVKLLAHQYRGRNCLDVIFSYLAGLEEAPITTPYSGGRRIIDTARPFYSERGYASTQSSIPRRQIRSTEPNCSICHAPAELNCDCERKGFDVLVRQAEDKMMSSTYKDIKAWVRRHAQDFSANEYMELTREIRSRQQQGGEAGTAASGGTLSREEINRRWSSAISALPGALDYFYGLVEWKTPDDDDPAVKDPPLSSRPKRDTAQAAYAR